MTGSKDDNSKAQYHLLDPALLEGLGKVLEFGASKYSAHNWRKGFVYSRLFNATLRHLFAWFYSGDDLDKESGLSHLDHAACNIMFLQSFIKSGRVELDDRFKKEDYVKKDIDKG